MLVTSTEFAMRWGEEYPRIESVAVETIGSKLRLMLAPWESIAPGLQYCTSEDGEEWNDWADMPILGAVDVPYPGYFKFRCIYAPATVRFYNLKTAAEADSLTGLTVVAGKCEVRLIE